MKKNIRIIIVTGFLVFLVGAGLLAQSPKPDSSTKVWQHLALEHEGKSITSSPELARKINSLGAEGWELVDVESISEAGTTAKTVFYFKRPK